MVSHADQFVQVLGLLYAQFLEPKVISLSSCAWTASSWASSSSATSARLLLPTGFSWHRTQPFGSLTSSTSLPATSIRAYPLLPAASGRDGV